MRPTPSVPKEIEQILDNLHCDVLVSGEKVIEGKQEAKTAILDLIAGIIGEDEPETEYSEEKKRFVIYNEENVSQRNQLRAIQRKRAGL